MRGALFLDRDGVINVDTGYLHRAEDCHFVAGIFDLVRRANEAGLPVFVVTNQAGIGRGYYSETQFLAFMDWMLARFAEHHAPLTKVYYCPHHPTDAVGDYRRHCACRKPGPGMLLEACREFAIDAAASTMIGNALSDMRAAEQAGIGRRIMLVEGTAPDLGVAGASGRYEVTRSLDAVGFAAAQSSD